MGQTLAEKIMRSRLIPAPRGTDGVDLLYVDLHLVHEVSSPQAFDALRARNRRVRRPDLTLALEDHNTPTINVWSRIEDETSRLQIEALRMNCKEFGIRLHSMGDIEQGIVHVVGPQLGLTQPGMVIVCGDSHTSTHGAFGALAFGIGTSEVEHALVTQTVTMPPFKTMAITVNGVLPEGVTAKDLILTIINRIGTGGGRGHVIEYRGSTIRKMSMDARMTLCNMSIECGARAGMIAPDETTFAYIRGRPHAPSGRNWDRALAHWSGLRSDDDAVFDQEVIIDASEVHPFVTWGTNPSQGVSLTGSVPLRSDFPSDTEREAYDRAMHYMDLEPGTPMKAIPVDVVFLGSCTNGRLEDLRAAAQVLAGRTIAPGVRMLVVPGSERVRQEAEAEGLDEIFREFGAEWRHSGCSLCLGMNPDRLSSGERCASTSNRNFEGRQGKGGRTHLVSPVVAAATAVRGTLSAPSDLERRASSSGRR